jgi:hypothetical protein
LLLADRLRDQFNAPFLRNIAGLRERRLNAEKQDRNRQKDYQAWMVIYLLHNNHLSPIESESSGCGVSE